MNIPWLRKLYGHLYGLFEIENIGNKKYLFLHQFFSSMNINKKIKTEDKHIIWESSVLSNRLNSFSEKVGQKILNVQKYSSTFFEHAKRSMFSKMAIINNKVKERMSIYYHKFNVFRIFLSKQLNDFTLKTNYLRFDIMQNFNIFFYQNARKFLNQIKTKVEIDLMKVYLLQKNAIEFTKSYYNFFNELVSVIKFKIQRVAISLRNSSNHYFDFLRDLNQNVKKISIRLLDSALRIIYTVKIKFLNISKYEIIKIKDLRKKLINRLLYLVMLLKIIERQSEDEKSSKSNFIFNVFFIIKSISLNIFNRLKNILFN